MSLEESVKKNTEYIARHILEHKTLEERFTKLEKLFEELMEDCI